MPAHMTAKIVIASAARFTAVRQRWRKRKRIAEISVPAWPMPIHQTKLIMSQPHITELILPQTPTPVVIWYDSMNPNRPSRHRLGMNAAHHHNGAEPSVTQATRSEIQANPRWLAT